MLAKAASGNGSSSIDSLLEAQNADGQTALHLACRRGSTDLVEAILEYKEADVDVLDIDGDPPIVFALAAGSPECVRALVNSYVNVRSRLKEDFGPSVARVYAYHGQPDCMRELLLTGADPNAVDDEGESVLHRAISKKYTECATVISENGGCRSMVVLNVKNLTPLHMCMSTWYVAVVTWWVEVASPGEIAEAIGIPSPVGTTLCMAAALKKDLETDGREFVRILLSARADAAAQDTQHFRTALHTAAMANDVDLVKDDECDNAFHIAADAAKMIRENPQWIVIMLRYPNPAIEFRNHSCKTLRDFLEALPREWISEDLMESLMHKGIQFSPTIYDIGDWVKFRRSVKTPTHGWQGAWHKSVGFVQSVQDKDNLIVSFFSGEARVLTEEVIKVIPLDRGQHVQLKPDVK